MSLGFASVALFEFLPAPGLQARSSWPRFLSSKEHSRGHCAAASQDSSSPYPAGGPFLPQTLCTCSSPRKLLFPCLCLCPTSLHPLISINFHLLKESSSDHLILVLASCMLPSQFLSCLKLHVVSCLSTPQRAHGHGRRGYWVPSCLLCFQYSSWHLELLSNHFLNKISHE